MGRSKYCPDCRNRVTQCVICGANIVQKNPEHDVMTCSRKCAGEYRKRMGISKQASKKSLETKIKRYGNGSGASYSTRVCALCGKPFVPNGSAQRFCKDSHYGPCPVCGKPSLIKDLSSGKAPVCSEECRIALITKLARERDNSESVKKYQATCLARYGVDNYAKTAECKSKVKATNLERYGGAPLVSTECKEKAQQTCLAKYGVDNPSKNDDVKSKIRDVLTKRYGGMGMASPVLRAKAEATNEDKYGDKHPARTLQCKEKGRLTQELRYGAASYASTKEGVQHLMRDPSKIDAFWEFRNNPVDYIHTHYEGQPYADQVAADVGVNETSIYDVLIRKDCKDLINRSRTSIIEREVHSFLTTLISADDIIQCDRRTIAPLEFDFYIPRFKFAIECNPTYTHNSSIPSFGEDNPKSTVYHRNKTNAAEEKGVFLMHIFGYDWEYRRDVIKSMIRSVLGQPCDRIFARNTYVKEVSYNDSCSFLNANHRQGAASSSIRLGLYDSHSNELVALMTFGKVRNTISKRSTDGSDAYELIRFCSLLNTTVVGGASKLFKYFIKSYHPEEIVSFSDRAHTRGNLYPMLGFEEVSRSEPGYVWVNIQTEEYKNRVACQKHNLPKLFDDVTEEDIMNHTENEIMMSHGYAKVFDSGVIRWEWTPNTEKGQHSEQENK